MYLITPFHLWFLIVFSFPCNLKGLKKNLITRFQLVETGIGVKENGKIQEYPFLFVPGLHPFPQIWENTDQARELLHKPLLFQGLSSSRSYSCSLMYYDTVIFSNKKKWGTKPLKIWRNLRCILISERSKSE